MLLWSLDIEARLALAARRCAGLARAGRPPARAGSMRPHRRMPSGAQPSARRSRIQRLDRVATTRWARSPGPSTCSTSLFRVAGEPEVARSLVASRTRGRRTPVSRCCCNTWADGEAFARRAAARCRNCVPAALIAALDGDARERWDATMARYLWLRRAHGAHQARLGTSSRRARADRGAARTSGASSTWSRRCARCAQSTHVLGSAAAPATPERSRRIPAPAGYLGDLRRREHRRRDLRGDAGRIGYHRAGAACSSRSSPPPPCRAASGSVPDELRDVDYSTPSPWTATYCSRVRRSRMASISRARRRFARASGARRRRHAGQSLRRTGGDPRRCVIPSTPHDGLARDAAARRRGRARSRASALRTADLFHYTQAMPGASARLGSEISSVVTRRSMSPTS